MTKLLGLNIGVYHTLFARHYVVLPFFAHRAFLFKNFARSIKRLGIADLNKTTWPGFQTAKEGGVKN
jgi:hypothetical protein